MLIIYKYLNVWWGDLQKPPGSVIVKAMHLVHNNTVTSILPHVQFAALSFHLILSQQDPIDNSYVLEGYPREIFDYYYYYYYYYYCYY